MTQLYKFTCMLCNTVMEVERQEDDPSEQVKCWVCTGPSIRSYSVFN